ncbi:MAG: hypothetical protein KDD61_03805 [Bdellovibrionales bacterium]|nr:hypothetical protein [Bdellovibrionales bacterium]
MSNNPSSGSKKQQFDKIVGRLSTMVSRIYGGYLTYVPINDLSKGFRSRYELQLNKSRWSIVDEKDLYCSINYNGEVCGACRIRLDRPLSHKEIAQLHTTIQLTISSALASLRKIDSLKEIESQLETALNHSVDWSLFDQHSVGHWQNYDFNISVQDGESTELNLSCLIFSADDSTGRKVALEIHNFSDRFAFVSSNDIDPRCLENPQRIYELGRISLLVPEILDLSNDQQCGILEYLASLPGREGPTILVVTQRPMQELKSNPQMVPQLLKRLSSSIIVASSTLNLSQTTQVARSFVQATKIDQRPPQESLI